MGSKGTRVRAQTHISAPIDPNESARTIDREATPEEVDAITAKLKVRWTGLLDRLAQ